MLPTNKINKYLNLFLPFKFFGHFCVPKYFVIFNFLYTCPIRGIYYKITQFAICYSHLSHNLIIIFMLGFKFNSIVISDVAVFQLKRNILYWLINTIIIKLRTQKILTSLLFTASTAFKVFIATNGHFISTIPFSPTKPSE